MKVLVDRKENIVIPRAGDVLHSLINDYIWLVTQWYDTNKDNYMIRLVHFNGEEYVDYTEKEFKEVYPGMKRDYILLSQEKYKVKLERF